MGMGEQTLGYFYVEQNSYCKAISLFFIAA